MRSALKTAQDLISAAEKVPETDALNIKITEKEVEALEAQLKKSASCEEPDLISEAKEAAASMKRHNDVRVAAVQADEEKKRLAAEAKAAKKAAKAKKKEEWKAKVAAATDEAKKTRETEPLQVADSTCRCMVSQGLTTASKLNSGCHLLIITGV